MNNFKHYILAGTALLLSGWALTSCSADSLPEPDPVTPDAQLPSLSISLGIAGQSRATGSDNEFEKGIGYENYLDIKGDDYRLYFFGADNKYIATFQPSVIPIISPSETLAENLSYIFMGEVPTEMKDIYEFKLVVLANWGVYPPEAAEATPGKFELVKGVTTIKDLTTHTAAQFTALASPADGESWLGDNRLIPFYGVRSYSLKLIVPGNFVDNKVKPGAYFDLTKSPLPLLRAMARIEVILNTFGSFESVELTKSNAKGYSAPYLPTGWNFTTEDYYKLPEDMSMEGLWDANYVKGVHLTAGTDQNDTEPQSIQLRKVSEDGEIPEVWRAYVPEYKNIGTADYTTIKVKVAGTPEGVDPIKTIYFAPNGSEQENTNGNREDIKRNNIYRFTITEMTTSFNVQVDIQPFAEVILELGLGLRRDEQGDLMVFEGTKTYQQLMAYLNDNPNKKPKVGSYDSGVFETGTYDRATGIFTPGADADPIAYRSDLGDYYAIVLGPSGNIQGDDTEIWIKDESGCRIISNFAPVIEGNNNDQRCSARRVRDFSSGSSVTYFKDEEGFQRLQHNNDHSSIILNKKKEMMLKTVIPDPNNQDSFITDKQFAVESWDSESGEFWYITWMSQNGDNVTITFRKGNIDGVPENDKLLESDNEKTFKHDELSERDERLLEEFKKQQT